jgi:ATP-binding cassette, subfamily B (MDR/TAP), member 1
MREKAFSVFYGFVGVIIACLFGFTVLFWGFGVASERMNKRVRDSVFSALLRQEVGWFDVRSPGAITSRLSDDAALLHSFTGEPVRTLTSSLASVLVGVIVSFIFMW